ncbi:Hypothetical Protein RSKD131_2768 [Cereibacter sphaeroides KD131]|nr:Hypothetical Protein RSKD131_2768 [Cereibacter sphaeroides KD131]
MGGGCVCHGNLRSGERPRGKGPGQRTPARGAGAASCRPRPRRASRLLRCSLH